MTIEPPDENASDPGAKPPSRRRRRAVGALDAPTLGYIPATPGVPAPVLADPIGHAATAYRRTVDVVRAATTARVLLVAAATADVDAGLTALNLGLAAALGDVRSVVVDGDASGRGPSRYLRTGIGAGLTDIATGRAGLNEASRLIEADAIRRLPFVTAGSSADAEYVAADIADAIDRLSEHADLVLVYLPGDAPGHRAAALGAHADGSLLVAAAERDGEAAAMAERLGEVGAPVVGLIEHARRKRRRGMRRS